MVGSVKSPRSQTKRPKLCGGRAAGPTTLLRSSDFTGAPNTGLDARIYFEDLRTIIAPLREALLLPILHRSQLD
jgi:hypothetical protein